MSYCQGADEPCSGVKWKILLFPFPELEENSVILAWLPKSETPFWILEYIFIA